MQGMIEYDSKINYKSLNPLFSKFIDYFVSRVKPKLNNDISIVGREEQDNDQDNDDQDNNDQENNDQDNNDQDNNDQENNDQENNDQDNDDQDNDDQDNNDQDNDDKDNNDKENNDQDNNDQENNDQDNDNKDNNDQDNNDQDNNDQDNNDHDNDDKDNIDQENNDQENDDHENIQDNNKLQSKVMPPDSQVKIKIPVCYNLIEKGNCTFIGRDGNACRFTHPKNLYKNPSKGICKYWLQGLCLHMETKCQYMHPRYMRGKSNPGSQGYIINKYNYNHKSAPFNPLMYRQIEAINYLQEVLKNPIQRQYMHIPIPRPGFFPMNLQMNP